VSKRPSPHKLYETGPYVANYIALSGSLVLLIRAIINLWIDVDIIIISDRRYSTFGAFDSSGSRCILNPLFIFFTEYFTNDPLKEDEVTVIHSTHMRDAKSIQHINLKV
jgi:hypothetical protein